MYRTSKIPTENTGDYRTIPEGVLSQKVLSFFAIVCVVLWNVKECRNKGYFKKLKEK